MGGLFASCYCDDSLDLRAKTPASSLKGDSLLTHLFGYSIPLPPYLTVGLFAAFWVFLSWFLSHIFQTHVCSWAEKTNSVFGKLLVRVLHGPLLAFLLLIGGEVILEAVDVPPKMLRFAQVSA